MFKKYSINVCFRTGFLTIQIVAFAQKKTTVLLTFVNWVDIYFPFCYNIYEPDKKTGLLCPNCVIQQKRTSYKMTVTSRKPRGGELS